MPLRIENIKLAGTKFDGRAKLSPEQRQAIQILAREGIAKEDWPLCSMLVSGLYNLYYLLLFASTLNNIQQNIGQS